MITKMNNCIRSLLNYFESVIHPAGGSGEPAPKPRKKNTKSTESIFSSPESVNIRGAIMKKQDKLRRNPAP
jgi:hypothetical protein